MHMHRISDILPPVFFPFPYIENSGAINTKILEVWDASQAPLPIVFQGGMSVMSFLLQNLVDVVKPNGQVVPPSQYFIAVAASGERKTTVDKMFYQKLERLESDYDQEYAKEVTDYELSHQVWVAVKKQRIRDIAQGKSDDIEALYEHEQSKPEHPARVGIKTLTDTTPEAALDVFHRESVKSGILRSSEGEEVLGGHAVRKLSLWNSLWSADAVRVNRKTSASFTVAPRMTLFLQAQPSVMQRFVMKGGENARVIGLFARTLITFPASTQGSRPNNPIQEVANDDYDQLIEEFFEQNIIANTDPDFSRRRITFSLPAQERWFLVANAIEWEINPNGRFAGYGDHASKLADNIARLAVLLHCSRHGLEGEVSLETLEQAIGFSFWFSNEFLRLFNNTSEEQRDYFALQDWFNQKRQEGYRYLKKNHVRKYCPNALRDSGKLNIILNHMLNNGEIRIGVVDKKTIIDLYPSYMDDMPLLTSVINS